FPTRRSSDLRRQRFCDVSLVLPYPAQLVADDGQQPLFPVVPRPLNQLLHRSAVWLLVQLHSPLPLGDAASLQQVHVLRDDKLVVRNMVWGGVGIEAAAEVGV